MLFVDLITSLIMLHIFSDFLSSVLPSLVGTNVKFLFSLRLFHNKLQRFYTIRRHISSVVDKKIFLYDF